MFKTTIDQYFIIWIIKHYNLNFEEQYINCNHILHIYLNDSNAININKITYVQKVFKYKNLILKLNNSILWIEIKNELSI